MASGIGYEGGRYLAIDSRLNADDSSRCYGFWQDYFDCYGMASRVLNGMELTDSECGSPQAV